MKSLFVLIKEFRYQIEVIVSIIIVLVVGSIGYMTIEKWSFYESIYMTVITITTVGFGETKPLSEAGRVFTIFLIFIGLGTAATFVTVFTRGIVEKQLRNYFGGNKMKKLIDKLENHYIVCGYGNIGKIIAETFVSNKIPFVVIENNEMVCEGIEKTTNLFIHGNATEDGVLIEAGIKKANGVITVLRHDSDNLFVSLAARELNSDILIISRGNEAHIEKRILRAGANMVVYPLKLGGEQIANIVAEKYGGNDKFDFENCPAGLMGYSMKIYHHFETKSILVRDVVKKTNAIQALFLRKADGVEIDMPNNKLAIKKDDNVLVLVKDKKE